ncbi:hypothetical protein IDJ77_11560 [Mucilaginibacter sp. ZT4R22]|uniref:Uncharacterized protein n=1 Tax=Mucilaginibacter pankratovii TaxID=2772110 RepID=A0ABR7WQG2_9SPHI|nr:hypothetical protein [Mucilaginibacter pankratovii]MBD1364446.1 hypothetical protein [Mucilaginibacter pankratovii]
MSFINERRGKNASATSNKSVLTAAMCLAKYIQPKTLLDFVDVGRFDDVSDLDKFIVKLNENGKYNFPRKVRQDKGGLNYKYISVLESNGPEGFKVVLLDNMDQFLRDYHLGLFTINFTLEDLAKEAEKA